MESQEGKMSERSDSREIISTKLLRIAELARQAPDMVMLTLAHHIDKEFLRDAYRQVRKDAAPGVDGVTAAEYATNLEANLEALLERFKSGAYKAPPVKRKYIPKAGSPKQRPIGMPTFEDKVLQKAVSMILNAVYEQDFLDCSYGYRPGRSQHQALEKLWKTLMDMKGGWVLEIDISDFFGTLRHTELRSMLDQRVGDGIIRRTIHKWLNAGVMEEGYLRHPESGSPQGGTVSPILSNVYLHEVMDKWFEYTVKPRLKEPAAMIRFADDIICVFESETDARRVMEVIPKRFAKYGLTLHPTKTRLTSFQKPKNKPEDKSGPPDDPGTFSFLGFTHYWGETRRKRWSVYRKTGKDRLRRVIAAITEWCRKNRHEPLDEQKDQLDKKLTGHYGYYGITGNYHALTLVHYMVERNWYKWLKRRSELKNLTWERYQLHLQMFPLAPPRIVHSYVGAAKP
jgi:RNA-directed DNA polymerase